MKKLISLLMALLMAAAVMTGCTDDKKSEDKAKETQEQSQEKEKNKSDDKKENVKSNAKERTDFGYTESIKAEKISTLDSLGDKRLSTKNFAPYYTLDDKYGFISFDGSYDSGAVYTTLDFQKGYYIVSTKEAPKDREDIAGLNREGLVSADGKEIIEQKYAMLEVLNERFVMVIEATQTTESREESLFYVTSNAYSIKSEEGDTRYKGNWYIYDIKENKYIDGLTGDYLSRISAKGNIIVYSDENGKDCFVDANGETVENIEALYTDGTYEIKTNDGYAIYSVDGKELFSFTKDDYIIYGAEEDGYFKAGSNNVYFLVDSTGKKVSADFDKSVAYYNGIIASDNKIYKLDGTPISDKKFTTIAADEFFNDVILCEGDGMIYMFKKDGTMLCEVEKSDGVFAHSTGFTITRSKDGESKMYCMKDKDFTLDYYTTGRWFGIADVGTKEEVYSAIDGSTLISGYDKHLFAWDGKGNAYIFAYNTNGEVDVYQIL